jgi:alkanesulfonate monooxygenase SsuD/methylene tetrahydromethanopterin reductase-like flavin-dependent oxidoreductase (luciferase family)
MREQGWLVGTPQQVVEQLAERAALGVSRVMFQHFDQFNDEVIELIAQEVLPGIAAGE